MINEDLQALQAVQKDNASADEWRRTLARHYPHVDFVSSPLAGSDSTLPTPVRSIRLRKLRKYFGLVQFDRLHVDLNEDWAMLETDPLLISLGVALQGDLFLNKQDKKTRYARAVRGPKADTASMRALLRTDIFSALVQYGAGDKDAVKRKARRRAEALLTARHGADPSLFALPLALETINIILPSLPKNVSVMDRLYFNETMIRADEVVRCIDPQLLNEWYGFGQAAQDMAWRGASKRHILGAAFMADAPYIRNIAMTISDMTNLVAHAPDQLTSSYSSFCDIDSNARAHEHAVELEFEWVLEQDPLVHGSRVFLQAANRQIDNLQKGQVVGLCASALHDSAKAFDDHGGGNRDSLIAAREAFDRSKNLDSWDQLSQLGEIIVDRCRKGMLTGLRELHDMTSGKDGLGSLRDALDSHLIVMNAPASSHKLEHAFAGPSIHTKPAMEPIIAPSAPRLVSMPSVPGLGGGSTQRVVTIPQNGDEQHAQ